MYPLPVPPMPKGAEQYGAYWDEAAARKATAAFPHFMRHTEGEWAGRPFYLADWQRDRLVRPVFGWKRADGTRLIRIVWLEVPRKNGKTELLAGVSLIAFVGDAEKGGQAYSMAVDKNQARIVFDKAGVMVNSSPELKKRLTVFKTSIYCAELMAGFKPLSKGAGGKHGLSATVVVGDEVHEWTDGGELCDVVHKSTAARRQPLELFATTAGISGEGYAWEMHELALMVLAGEVEDPTFLPIIFAAEEGDDWTAEATFRKANPNFGVSVKPEFLRKEATGAARSPSKENDFKRFHLNLWTEQAKRWLPIEEGWNRCTADRADKDRWKQLFEVLKGRKCYAGLDLAITDDITSWCLGFPPADQLPIWTFLWRFWRPQATVADEPLPRQKKYEAFEKRGAITLTPGNVTDYDIVEKQILADAVDYQIGKIGIDKFNASQLGVKLLNDHGLPVEWFRQGFLSMNAPCKEFERMVMAEGLEHGNHPVAAWMARNAATEKDPHGNIKLVKAKAADKIDGIVAAVMSVGLHLGAEPEQSAGIYIL